MLARDMFGDGAERAIDGAFEFESSSQDADLKLSGFVGPCNDSAGWRYSVIALDGEVDRLRRVQVGRWVGRIKGLIEGGVGAIFGWRAAQVRIVGQFGRSQLGTLGNVPFELRLNPPDDSLDQPGFVVGFSFFAKYFCVLKSQLPDGHPFETRNFGSDIDGHECSCCWLSVVMEVGSIGSAKMFQRSRLLTVRPFSHRFEQGSSERWKKRDRMSKTYFATALPANLQTGRVCTFRSGV